MFKYFRNSSSAPAITTEGPAITQPSQTASRGPLRRDIRLWLRFPGSVGRSATRVTQEPDAQQEGSCSKSCKCTDCKCGEVPTTTMREFSTQSGTQNAPVVQEAHNGHPKGYHPNGHPNGHHPNDVNGHPNDPNGHPNGRPQATAAASEHHRKALTRNDPQPGDQNGETTTAEVADHVTEATFQTEVTGSEAWKKCISRFLSKFRQLTPRLSRSRQLTPRLRRELTPRLSRQPTPRLSRQLTPRLSRRQSKPPSYRTREEQRDRARRRKDEERADKANEERTRMA